MKPNELMIGDWVSFNGTPKKITLLTATQPLAVDPIPLTEEILEANGWNGLGERLWQIKCNGIWVCVDFDNSEYSFIEEISTYEDENSREIYSRDYIPYVHELQHALRLVGLSDLADNFKIS